MLDGMNFASSLESEEESDDLCEKEKETSLFSSLDKMTHPPHLFSLGNPFYMCVCVCAHELVHGQRGGRGVGGRGQENHGIQSEENKVLQGSRPRPQEFWDK